MCFDCCLRKAAIQMRDEKSGKRIWIFVANFLIISFIIIYVAFFSKSLNVASEKEELNKIADSVENIKQEVINYMNSSSKIVDDWAYYAKNNKWNIEETVQHISEVNSDDKTMVQVVFSDSLKGYSSLGGIYNDKEIDYSGYYNLSKELELFRNYSSKDNADDVYITSAFTNNVNAIKSVAFVSRIKVYIEDGESRDAFLMRVEPLEALQSGFTTGSLYDGANMCLITYEGNYITSDNMFKNNNFYDFLRIYNDINYSDIEELLNEIANADKPGILRYKDSSGTDTIYSYSTRGYNDWIVLEAIAEDKLDVEPVQWSLLIVLTIAFAILIGSNLIYFDMLNRELKMNVLELEKANAAKTNFLSSMSHDIRTPMNAINGLTVVAMHNLDDGAYVEECLSKISLSSRHLLTLINDILDISQIESGKLTFNPAVFSLDDSVEELINIIFPLAEAKGLRCDVYLKHVNQEYLYADKLRLNQIWINLLSNAVKYTDNGGKIEIYLREEDIEENPSKVRLIFTVKDNGIGMSEEYISKIFKPFTRETDSRVNKAQGSGLGMAIIKQIVDMLGGDIRINSKKGYGTTVAVTVDLDRAKGPTYAPEWKNTNVLIIGAAAIMESTRQYLHEFGINSSLAETFDKAISMIDKKHDKAITYDAIIIDRPMRDMECIDTARSIHKYMDDKCPKILISTFDYGDIEKETTSIGNIEFIGRPIFCSMLYKKMSELFDKTGDSEGKPSGIDVEADDLTGVHLLVAEDNDLNWEIIRELLNMYNITADRTVNGLECLNVLNRASADTYNMIFMDIQMPVMNGYEATKSIRKLANKKKADIPIVAMTANAFGTDISACYDAGMNGYVSKPVDIKLVLNEIRKNI